MDKMWQVQLQPSKTHRRNVMLSTKMSSWRRYFTRILTLWITCLLLLTPEVSSQSQSFRETPTDTSIVTGSTAIFVCRVNNMKGALLWTKGGFSLGYGRHLVGFPRYAVIGNADLGENSLMISNVQLSDDDTYQCQVLPSGGDEGLRASAVLTVLIPPNKPQIDGHTDGSVVRVPHQQEELQMVCLCVHGKPAPELSWYRNGEPLSADDNSIVYSTEPLPDKRENAKSILTINPTKEDNEATYKCEATHTALRSPLATMVQLSVMHPPGAPEITGYANNQIVQTNHTLKLVCISRGGNPLAKVYWYKNGGGLDFAYDFGGNKAENEYTFLVQPTDNNAVYRCEASNQVTPVPLVSEVKLIVQFPPKEVRITGQEHAKAGETIKLKCTTSISNPPAVITWLSLGRLITEKAGSVTPSPRGGFVTTSEIEVTLTSRDDQVVYQCNANNEALGYVATDTISLKVVYPPGQPSITGYTEGREVTAEQIQTMTCQSMGGNPPATLTWWKGDELLTATTTRNFNLVSSQVSFILKPDDNQAQYRCNATNPATVEPLLATVTLTVNFPPKSLSISVTPPQGRVGERLSLECTSATSNPASDVYWTKDGEVLSQAINSGQVPAEHGGKSTISRLDLVPTVADHGEIYACNAKNNLIEMAVSDAVTLNVSFRPVFQDTVPGQFDIIEFGSGMVNVSAYSNPSDVEYVWYRGNHKVVMKTRKRRDITIDYFELDGGVLIINNITRDDSATYTVQASNNEGQTNHSIFINVQYEAEISRVSQNVLADKGTDARLECVVDGNPFLAEHVNWTREGYNMSLTETEFDGEGSRSILVIPQVEKEDAGLFVCTAFNGIGDESTTSAQLIVKYAPEIDKSPTYSKAAADKGAMARLICNAEGAPDVTFTWIRIEHTEKTLDVTGTKYSLETKKPGLVQYQSLLLVHNTTKADYGQYKCVARNALGEDSHVISLDGTSKPDPPFDVRVINATHNSVTLSWKHGFDGGSNQRFQVRYLEVGKTEGHKYADVVPQSASVFTVTGLKLATEYEMDIHAINRLGDSGYQPHPIRVKTSAWAAGSQQGDEVPLIIILVVSIIGMILLGLNVLLILFFIRRRRRKMEKDSASTVNTIEMYNAPTLTEDSKSVGTYDRRSFDEYQDDFHKHYEDDDELRRFLGPAPPYPSDMAPYVNSGYYPPPSSRNEYSPPPGLATGPHPGDRPPYGSMPAMYSSGTLPHFEPDMDDEDDYTYQLRKMQQGINGQPPPPGALRSESMSHLPPPSDPYNPRGPPPPPARASSRGALDAAGRPLGPPIPSRNYDNDDYRYPPPPTGPTYETVPSTRPRDGPPDVRGHLV